MADNLQAAKDFANDKLTRFAHVQTMSRSHVSGGFWLGGASVFSPHLLQGKNQVAFEYKGQHWPVVFMQEKAGFSGGWRQFAIDNSLAEGDVVVYEVISPDRLKLYFFRSKDWNGSRAQRPSMESMQYADAPTINWNCRRPSNTVEGRGEGGTPGGSAGGGSKSTAAPKPQKSKARGTSVDAIPGAQERGAAAAPAPSPRIRMKLPSAKRTIADAAPSSPLPSKKQNRSGSAAATQQDEEPAQQGEAGPSSQPATKRQRRGNAVAHLKQQNEGHVSTGAEQAAGSHPQRSARAVRGVRVHAAVAEAAASGKSPKSRSLMDLVHSSPAVEQQCVEGELWGSPSGAESEGGDEGGMDHHGDELPQSRSREGGPAGKALQSRGGQQNNGKKGGGDGDKEGVQKRGSRERGTGLNVSSRGGEEGGVSGEASGGRKRQQDKCSGGGDEGSSPKAAKRHALSSGRIGSGAKQNAQPETREQGRRASEAGVQKKLTAGNGSKVLDMQAVGGTGVEGGQQKKKSVTTKRPGPQPQQGKLSKPKEGVSKAKESVGSKAAVGVKSPAGKKVTATKPGKAGSTKLGKASAGAGGVQLKRKGGSGEESGGSKEKEKGGKKSGEGGPPKKKEQVLQQGKEVGPDVARFPERRRANAQPIEGKQMGLDGPEALQGFWNIAEPGYDCEGLLQEIRDVAKAEVRPVVVDEASGNCVHAPHNLTISGSLSCAWTYDPQTGYFPVRYVNRDGYYMRLEDGT